MHWLLPLILIALLTCCAAPPREQRQAIDLPPIEPGLPAERHVLHIQQLHEERSATQQAGETPSEDNYIWMGRRLAYLNRHNDAIAEFTEGLRQYPDSYKLLRHRGHRWITLRRFDLAVDDLNRAASLIEGVPDEVEPDGMPNRL
jgi:tetratricopeptide (TPR) repeat protein